MLHSDNLRVTKAETLSDLITLLPNVQEMHVRGLFDIQFLLEPHIKRVEHHTKTLYFKFCASSNDMIKVLYKANHDQPWKQLDNNILSTLLIG